MSDRPSNGGSAGYCGGPSAAGISSEGCTNGCAACPDMCASHMGLEEERGRRDRIANCEGVRCHAPATP